MQQNQIVPTSREVIEKKLLTPLEDENTVVALFSKADLKVIIGALAATGTKGQEKRHDDILAGLRELRESAFPELTPNDQLGWVNLPDGDVQLIVSLRVSYRITRVNPAYLQLFKVIDGSDRYLIGEGSSDKSLPHLKLMAWNNRQTSKLNPLPNQTPTS